MLVFTSSSMPHCLPSSEWRRWLEGRKAKRYFGNFPVTMDVWKSFQCGHRKPYFCFHSIYEEMDAQHFRNNISIATIFMIFLKLIIGVDTWPILRIHCKVSNYNVCSLLVIQWKCYFWLTLRTDELSTVIFKKFIWKIKHYLWVGHVFLEFRIDWT